jgi:hypothetical protein
MTVYALTFLSFANAALTLWQTRTYRLFNADVNAPVSSKSAYRVKVDSSPAASSPMRFFSDLIAPAATQSETPDDAVEDVWEIPVWDPSPVCLRTSILFSPGHVIVVWLFLPYTQSDPRPSVTVFSTLALCFLLSLQGSALQYKFSQQNKDSSSIYKEVSKEYNSKYVQPNAQKRPVRDVGVQFPHPSPVWDGQKGGWEAVAEVVSGSPYNSTRGFQTKPNSAYASHYDPNHFGSISSQPSRSRPVTTPSMRSYNMPPPSSGQPMSDYSSPIRHVPAARPYPPTSKSQYTSTGTGDGGSLGVYTHAASPLRKAASSNILKQGTSKDGRRRDGSPLKRSSMPAEGLHQRLQNSRDGSIRGADGRY